MPTDSDEKRLAELEEWFRQRGLVLRFDQVIGVGGSLMWLALMLPEGQLFGTVRSGHGRTKLAAAENAKAELEVRPPQTVTTLPAIEIDQALPFRAVGGADAGEGRDRATVQKREEIVPPTSPVDADTLKGIAHDFGIHTYYTSLNDQAWLVRVENDAGEELWSGLATDFDDAKLASILDLEKPDNL